MEIDMQNLLGVMVAPMDADNPAVRRYNSLCFHCGNCKWTCMDQAGVLGRYNLEKTGGNAVCIYCGQCANECPGFAMNEREEYPAVKEAIAAHGKVVIASTSPAVRASISEEFGLGVTFSQGKLVALLKKLGFDYVLDTNFAADLTIVEEATELVSRIKNGGTLPMFTSCCPSWVRYAEIFYPRLIPNISSVKSPICMQGPIIKTWFARNAGIDPKSIVNVAVAPCTAKKYEIRLPGRDSALGNGTPDMDSVITTRELAKWAREAEVDFASLEDMDYDSLSGTGAGAIFGATGGVMEAALRTAYFYLNGVNPPEDFMELKPIRGLEDCREAEIDLGAAKLNVAVIYGTANAGAFIDRMEESGKAYHFIEVMTCPGGCSGGGGQPKGFVIKGGIPDAKRVNALFSRDKSMALRLSHENPEIKALYRELLGEPGGEEAERLLHTAYVDRSAVLTGAKL